MSDPTISDRLGSEITEGYVDFTRYPTVPAIPSPTDDVSSLLRTVKAIKLTLDLMRGDSGSVLDKALTTRDLLNQGALTYTPKAGLVTAAPTYVTGGGSGSTGSTGTGGTYTDPRPVLLVTPPTPSNFSASGAFKNIILRWDLTQYRNHAYTEIWRNTGPTLNGAALADADISALGDNISGAALYDTCEATVYADGGVTTGQTYYYWIRAVNYEGAHGGWYSGTGVSATPAIDVSATLTALTGQIKSTQLFSDLGNRINLIDGADTLAGSVAARVKAELDARVLGDSDTLTSAKSYTYSKAEADTAISTSTNTVSTRLNNFNGSGVSVETSATATASTVTGLSGQYTVKVDSNGYVSGFGLASTTTGATPYSSFAVRADQFYIANPAGPGVAPSMPFIVQTAAGAWGSAGVYIKDAFIANGTITNAKIGAAAIDDAKIANLSAVKITAGTMDAKYITAGTVTASLMETGLLSADNVLTRGLTVRAADGTILLSSGNALSYNNITASDGWLNNKITVTNGILQNIGTSSVVVDNSFLPTSSNLVFNSDFALGVQGWSTFATSGLTVVQSGTNYPGWTLNGGAGRSTNTYYVSQGSRVGNGGYMAAQCEPFPVVAGKRYVFSFYSGAHRCSVVGILYWGPGGATGFKGTDVNNGSLNGGPTLAGYQRLVCSDVAPAGVSTAFVELRKYDTDAGNTSSYLFACRVQVEEVAANCVTAGSWSPGPSGFTGELNATYGAMAGTSLKDSSGTVLGDSAIKNSSISINSTGSLTGAGGGQVTTLPTLDIDRESNPAPNTFAVGTSQMFKHSAAIGLSDADGYWCTLQTIIQYPSNSGGYPGYQYVYQQGKTWRRHAANDAGTGWTEWTQDLDRNAYTGALDATKNQSDTTTNNGIIAAAKTAEWPSVTGTGRPADYATVGKSLALPFASWNLAFQYIATITDGKVGNKTLRLFAGSGYPNMGVYVPIDRTKSYRVRFWARPQGAANGLLYFTLQQFLDSAGTAGPVNGGRSPYKPSGQNRAGHNSAYGGTDQWGEYSYVWGPSDWQTGVQFVRPDFLDNYSGNTGWWEVQDFTWEEVTEVIAAQLSADNATTALDNKLNKNAADVLSGPISLTSTGAIVVGDYNKTGLVLNTSGILARQAGNTVLAFNSYDGSLTVKGDITGSTGSFAGSLSAVKGTFYGTVKVGNPLANGTSMLGSGALFSSNGLWVMGSATTNISYDGSRITLNGDVIATGNLVANSISQTYSAVGTGYAAISNVSIASGHVAVVTAYCSSTDGTSNSPGLGRGSFTLYGNGTPLVINTLIPSWVSNGDTYDVYVSGGSVAARFATVGDYNYFQAVATGGAEVTLMVTVLKR